jgi:hypothetical protein
LLPAGLQQLRVVVGDVEPLRLPILVGVDQLVRQVLLCGVLAHLDACSSNYSGVVGTRLGLHSEKLTEEYPVGFDPQESFAFDFFHSWLGFGVAETLAAMTLRRIRRLPLGISSSRRQSSSSWTARASFSRCTGFSLAFARGLWRWLPMAAHLDLRSALRWQCALAADSRQDLLGMATSAWGEKNPKCFGFYL